MSMGKDIDKIMNMRFTGERLVPSDCRKRPDLFQEHMVRYLFALDYVLGKYTLDVGCGTGYGTWILSNVTSGIIGVDKSHDAVSYALHRFRTNWRSLNYTVGDIERLEEYFPFPTYSFRAITAFEIMEHLEDPNKLLRNLPLHHNGKFLFSVPIEVKQDPYHLHNWTVDEVRRMMGRYFCDIKWYAQDGMFIRELLPPHNPIEFLLGVCSFYKKRISVITLSWDNLDLLKRFCESLRRTAPEVELVIVDQGSEDEARKYGKSHADIFIHNKENVGFSKGMNQGMEAATGDILVFVNNDVQFKQGWIDPLVRSLYSKENVGIVCPAVTAAGIPLTVRGSAGDEVLTLKKWGKYPSGVCYVTSRKAMKDVGGWSEIYEIASGEDADLCCSMWDKGYDILFDTRVLLDHIGKATAGTKLPDWRKLWEKNRKIFLERWGDKLEEE